MVGKYEVAGLRGPIWVLKFGGSSLADSERIRNAACRVMGARRNGNHLVVVVSAMAGETDRLLSLGGQFGPAVGEARQREFDALVSSGKQVSAALSGNDEVLSAPSGVGKEPAITAPSASRPSRTAALDSSEPERRRSAPHRI